MKKYMVTNADCVGGVWCALPFDTLEEAEKVSEEINRRAMRGLRPFSEVIEENKAIHSFVFDKF